MNNEEDAVNEKYLGPAKEGFQFGGQAIAIKPIFPFNYEILDPRSRFYAVRSGNATYIFLTLFVALVLMFGGSTEPGLPPFSEFGNPGVESISTLLACHGFDRPSFSAPSRSFWSKVRNTNSWMSLLSVKARARCQKSAPRNGCFPRRESICSRDGHTFSNRHGPSANP
jgi:hypothetical protein